MPALPIANVDWRQLLVDSSGNVLGTQGNPMYVSGAVAAGVGVAQTDNTVFTEGTTPFASVGGEYNTSPGSLTSGNQGACQVTIKRAIHVNPRDAVGGVLFPTAAALADATANPTLTEIAALSLGFNGTTWDRLKTAPGATGTTGTGLLGAGPCLWDLVGTTNFVKQAGDGSGRAMVVGAAAAGSAIAGNPVLAGGSDGTNARALKVTTGGTLLANPVDGAGAVLFPTAAALADATANPTLTEIAGFEFLYNGSTWDRRLEAPSASTAAARTGVAYTGAALWSASNSYIPAWTAQAAAGQAVATAGVLGVAAMVSDDLTNFQISRSAKAVLDAVAGGTLPTAATWAWNNASFDRVRTTPGVTGTTGTGLLSAGPCLWDLVGTTNFVKQAGDGSGRSMVVGAAAAGSAVAGNPLLTGGSDGTNARAFKLNTDGSIPVGGFTVNLVNSPTITAGAYTAGKNIGGLITLTSATRLSAGSGVIESIIISDKAKQSAAIDVIFFNAAPTTPTDNTTYAPTAADIAKIVGFASVLAASYSAFSANSVATLANVGMPFVLASGTSLYVVLVNRGTPTYTSTSDIQCTIGVSQD